MAERAELVWAAEECGGGGTNRTVSQLLIKSSGDDEAKQARAALSFSLSLHFAL